MCEITIIIIIIIIIGSDGVAVMLGSRSGVGVQLSNGLPHIIAVHSVAHRLELSFKEAANKNTCHKKLDSFLLGIYRNLPFFGRGNIFGWRALSENLSLEYFSNTKNFCADI